MPRKKVIHDKVCDQCSRPFQVSDGRRKRCDQCMDNGAKHRNTARAAALPKMFSSVDGEGRQEGEMFLVSFSIGREDGTSGSYVGSNTREALHWLIKQAAGRHTRGDGTECLQVVTAFHFNWDTAVLAKDFDPADMHLIRKVQARVETGLCGTVHENWDDCPLFCEDNAEAIDQLLDEMAADHEKVSATTKRPVEMDPKEILHRYNPADAEKIITDGGESDIIAFDPKSKLAISSTPGRRFYVEHRPNGDRFDGWKRVDIHDTGSAFVGGLLKVISDWNPELTDQQRAIIEWGKQRRTETFELDEIDKIIEYSEAECVAHARVCRKLLNLIKDSAHVTIKERELFGSGSIAGATLKYYKAPTREQSDLTYEDFGQVTYFGGMIETPVVGLIEGMTDEVDINSAYPHKMTSMPCMREGCGEWKKDTSAVLPADLIGHVKVRWFIEESTSTPPFIVRRPDGRVAMPRMMSIPTWVTLAECKAAVERFGSDIEIVEMLYWDANCECGNPYPFEFLRYLYDRRIEFKDQMKNVEADSPEWWNLSCQEKAIKLVINSIYGKMAQQDPRPGKYTNLHLASYITGATRAQVREESWAREDQGGIVVYQHTDSVLSIGGAPQDEGKALGAWGMEKQSKDFLIVQPGLATALGGGKHASRGCRLGAFKDAVEKWMEVVDLTQHPTTWPKLHTEQTVMISRRQALAWGKPHLAGSFQPKNTEISAVSPKRNVDEAYQMPGNPTAWVVPPLDIVDVPATLEDVLRMRKGFRDEKQTGKFDK